MGCLRTNLAPHFFFVVVTAGIQHGSRVVRDLQLVHVVFALLLVNRTAFS